MWKFGTRGPLACILWLLLLQGAAQGDEDFLYISSFSNSDGTVEVFDINQNAIIDSIPAGPKPLGLSHDPRRAQLYVANFSNASITIIDTFSRINVSSIPTPNTFLKVATSPDNRFAYVASGDPFNSVNNKLHIIDLNLEIITDSISLPSTPSGGISVASDGAKVLVSLNGRPNTLAVIDIASRQLTHNIPISGGGLSQGLAVTPDGEFAYGVDGANDRVHVIDVLNGTDLGEIFVATQPLEIVISSDGLRGYVSHGGTPVVSVLDLTTNTALTPIDALPARGLALTSDGATLYGAALNSNAVFVIDTASRSIVHEIPVTLPEFLAFGDTPPSSPPTAVTGNDLSIRLGVTVNLDGSNSFDDNTPSETLLYDWALSSKPNSSTAALSSTNTATASFIPDVSGTYEARLVVTDQDTLLSAPSFISISTDNLAPSADAGDDQITFIGETIWLDGSGSSDPEGDPLFFEWVEASIPEGSTVTLSTPTDAEVSFVPDIVGTYSFTLIVSDLFGAGSPDSINVVAVSPEEYAQVQIVFADEMIAIVAPETLTSEGHREAIAQFLKQTSTAVLGDDIIRAIGRLEDAIIRTDGCVINGQPDSVGNSRDWIIDCEVQKTVYSLLNDALSALETSLQ